MPVVPYWVLKSSFGTSKGVLTSKAPQRSVCVLSKTSVAENSYVCYVKIATS